MRRILIENEGIDATQRGFGMPWAYDATCYNFRMPNETIAAEEVTTLANKKEIESLVIGCKLNDYSFIKDMKNLRQLYIYNGDHMEDMDFIKELVNLSQLYIANSHIRSLEPLLRLISLQKIRVEQEENAMKRMFMTIQAICIESDNELDGSELLESGVYISEFIINRKKCEGNFNNDV